MPGYIFFTTVCGRWPPGRSFVTLCSQMDRARIESHFQGPGRRNRLLIFEAISKSDEINCGQIVSLQGVTPATVSHHLKILADAGLIECVKRGQFVYSRVDRKTLCKYTRASFVLARPRKK